MLGEGLGNSYQSHMLMNSQREYLSARLFRMANPLSSVPTIWTEVYSGPRILDQAIS